MSDHATVESVRLGLRVAVLEDRVRGMVGALQQAERVLVTSGGAVQSPRVYAELVTAMDHGALAIGGALPALSGYGEQARRDCHLNHVWKGGWT